MRIAVVFDTPYPRYSPERHRQQLDHEMEGKTGLDPEVEYQVGAALMENNHEILLIGLREDLGVILQHCDEWKPDLVMNCAEAFGDARHDYVVPAVLETAGYRYTGAPPLGLLVSRDKAMSKKILAYHDIKVPGFATWTPTEPVAAEPPLRFPLIVKPLGTDASIGISQASVVSDLQELKDRVEFVHQRFRQPAIAEEFIEGRELYASVVGNGDRIEVLPLTELVFDKEKNAPEERIATHSTKWDEAYRDRKSIRYQFARPVSAAARERIEEICRLAFRSLWLRDYARIDLRLTDSGEVWVLEANANPFIAEGHEVANAAEKAGMSYHQLIERIVTEARGRYELA